MPEPKEAKLRLDLAEQWIEKFCRPELKTRSEHLRALIALARAAKREVRCTCDDGPTRLRGTTYHNLDCALYRCEETAAELERWE